MSQPPEEQSPMSRREYRASQVDDVDAGPPHPAEPLSAPDDEDWAHNDDEPRRRSPLLRWGALLGAVAIVGVGAVLAWQVVGGLLPTFGFGGDDVADYPGPGSGEVTVEVPDGAGGGQIAEILASNDVVASASAFTGAAAVDPRSNSIQPGTYAMTEQMSAEGALERMLDPEFRQVNGVTIREGLWKEEVFTVLASETGFEVADYEAVDPADLDLPEAAGGEMEGYLFPDTYSFDSDATPTEQLSEMVALGKEKYAELGLEGEALDTALIKGSLIQAEGAFSDDLPKIARVIENRLDEGQPLGFDSTIHFIFGERGRAGTSDVQRASDSPYNTYLLAGLPPDPINSPGIEAIEAALDPEDGPWLYFVTVNPSTGETKFTETFEEHNENVAQFQQWCADNPDDC
ncbi:endolytic transglycosylase MltG [soil metagenome]